MPLAWLWWLIYDHTEWAVDHHRLTGWLQWTLPLRLVLQEWKRIGFINVVRLLMLTKNGSSVFLPLSFFSKMAQSFSALFSGVLSSLGRFECFSLGMSLKMAWSKKSERTGSNYKASGLNELTESISVTSKAKSSLHEIDWLYKCRYIGMEGHWGQNVCGRPKVHIWCPKSLFFSCVN